MNFDFIPTIMKEASGIMLSAHDIDSAVKSKSGDANFVTAYDVAVEDFLFEKLGHELPDAVIIGEEADENHTELLKSRLCLIIDPIDGTTNYIHNYRYSAISVGIIDCGTPVYGAVYDPYEDRLFHAERGFGAYVLSRGNDNRIHVSDRHLKDSLCGFGTSPYYREELAKKTFDTVYRLFMATHDVRRSGSAALDLTDLAFGSLDIFLEMRLSPWDYAAGSVLVTEAGGVITQTDGSPIVFEHPCPILAGNPTAHAELLECGIL